MTDDDVIYYTRRAVAEYEQATKATRPEVMRVHEMMAAVYRDRIAAAQAQPQVADV